MGLLYRCSDCDKEMVLESYHQGRTVPCPWCGASEDIPNRLDFETVYTSRAADERRGRLLLAVSVASLLLACLPASAVVWWLAAGSIGRAREDQREADPLLLNARVIAAVGTVIHGLVWAGFAIVQVT
jgi:hypothetical protein